MAQFNPSEYWETRLTNDFDLRGVGHRALGVPYNKWAYRIRREVFLRLLRSLNVDFSSAESLDVGAGTGFYIDRWLELGVPRVTAVDLTEAAVTGLRRRYPRFQIHKLDIGGDIAGLRGHQFDCVSCMDVLFHIVDDARYQTALANMHSILKPGGYLIFSEQFPHASPARSVHVVHRTLETIRGYLHEAGFEIIQRRPMFVLMEEPVDSNSRCLGLSWSIVRHSAMLSRLTSFLVGAAVYPLELMLVRTLSESPTSEIAVCRRLQ